MLCCWVSGSQNIEFSGDGQAFLFSFAGFPQFGHYVRQTPLDFGVQVHQDYIIWSGSPYESCPSNSGKAYVSVLASVVTHAWTRCAWCSSEAVRPIRRPDVSVEQAPSGDWIEKSKEKRAILIWSMFFAAQVRKLLEELADDLSIAKVIGTVGTSRRQSRKLFRVVIH